MRESSLAEVARQLRLKFAALQRREQQALLILAVALGLTLGWLVLVAPALEYYESEQQRYQRNQQLAQWIASHEHRFQRQQGTGAQALGSDWINRVTRVAAEQGLQIRSFTPEGTQAVRIQMENQPFSSLMPWLVEVERQFGIVPGQTDISAGSAAGQVNVRLTLRKP